LILNAPARDDPTVARTDTFRLTILQRSSVDFALFARDQALVTGLGSLATRLHRRTR